MVWLMGEDAGRSVDLSTARSVHWSSEAGPDGSERTTGFTLPFLGSCWQGGLPAVVPQAVRFNDPRPGPDAPGVFPPHAATGDSGLTEGSA